MFVHPLNHEEEEEGKNLKFITGYAQGLLIFHQSFLHFTSGTCRFKHFQKRIIDITFFLIPIPEDNILDHPSLLSYPPSHTSTVNGIVLSVGRKRKLYQNRSTRMLVKLMAPEYHGLAPVFWIPGCYDSRHHSRWFQGPYWWFTIIILGDFRVHTGDSPSTHDLPCLSCLLVSSELALCSTLVTLVVRTCHLIFWSLSTILPDFFVDSPTSVIPQHFGDIHTVC